MGIFSSSMHTPWVFAFGLLGNIVSFAVFLAPVQTFWRIWRRKSTEGFESLPYIAALLSASVWIYYASLKSSSAHFLLITINSLGCLIESLYLLLYIIFAPSHARMVTLRLLVLLDMGGFCSILLLSHFVLAKEATRIRVLGCICVALSVSVFAAPLSAVRRVIRTKSVEFMPFSLSLSLTMNAVIWLFYGILLNDFYVAIPNIVGFIFGVLQMVLYVMYRRKRNPPVPQVTDQGLMLPVTYSPSSHQKQLHTSVHHQHRTDNSNIGIQLPIQVPVAADEDHSPNDCHDGRDEE